jgi:hypothetical protein
MNQVEIHVEFGKLRTVIDWCNNNCSGNWSWAYDEDIYSFIFDNESDATAFSMQWK